jgi:hypothetical protein
MLVYRQRKDIFLKDTGQPVVLYLRFEEINGKYGDTRFSDDHTISILSMTPC